MIWTAVTKVFFGCVLAFSLLLIFASLGQMPIASVLLTHVVLGSSLLVWCLLRLVNLRTTRFDFFFFCYLGFIVWLVFQTFAQRAGLPLFGTATHWGYRFSLFSAFFSGFILYLLTTELLAGRKGTIGFVHFFVFLSSLFAVYLVSVFFTIPHFFENPQTAFPLLEKFSGWTAQFIQPNNTVDLYLPAVFFSLSLAFYWHTRRLDTQNLQKVYGLMLVHLCFACVLAAAVLFTQSRAGILSFFFGLAVYLTFFTLSHRRRGSAVKRLAIFFGVAALFLASLGMKTVIQEMMTVAATVSEEGKMQGVRILTMAANWQVIGKHGLFGAGLGNFEQAWFALNHIPHTFVPVASYNDFLWLWAETGLPGVVLFGLPLLYLIVRSLVIAIKTESYTASYFLTASVCGLIAILTHALVDTTLYIQPILWLLMIVAGVATKAIQIDSEEKGGEMKKPQPVPLTLICIALLTAIAASSLYLNVNRMRAWFMTRNTTDLGSFRMAAKLDRWAPIYPAALADFYANQYEASGVPEVFEMAIDAIDRAIELDPLRIDLYPRRARLFLKTGEDNNVHKTFEWMERNFPDFYRAQLVASAFYMNESLETTDPHRASYFETRAIRHYLRALELYPQFDRQWNLFRIASPKAIARYQELAAETQT